MRNKNHPSETLPIDNSCQTGLPLFSGGVFIMENEIWKDIPNYNGMYQVSSLGRVMSSPRIVVSNKGKRIVPHRILKAATNRSGYLLVVLSKKGISKTIKVHRLVAIAFLNNKENDINYQVNHINCNKADNRLINLEIVSSRENVSAYYLLQDPNKRYIGVSKRSDCNRWLAKATVGKKQYYLGLYKTEEEAAVAYATFLKNITEDDFMKNLSNF